MSDIKATGWVFAQVPIWLLCNSEISDGAKTLFSYLKYRQGTDIACWPSKETMAHDLGTSKGTIARRTRELEKHKYLVKHSRIGQTTLYEMIAEPEGEHERWRNLENARKEKKQKDRILAAIQTHVKNDTPPPIKNDTPPPPKNDTHDNSHKPESLNENHIDAPSAQPPPCFSEQFTLSVSKIKDRKFTRSEWETVLKAEKVRPDKPPRSTLVKWLERKLHGSGHPAIQAYHSEMGSYPRKNQFQDIIEVVGEGGTELFTQIVRVWRLAGWNRLNIGGMLECHSEGRIPGNGKRKTQGSTQTDGENLGPNGAPRPGEPAAFQGIRDWLQEREEAR